MIIIKILLFFLSVIICLSTYLIPIKARENLGIIVIDPGHGGVDNGASHLNLIEDELNLIISFKLGEYLLNNGYQVYFTRDGDYDLSIENTSNHKRYDLNERIKLINKIKPNLFVSIHMNKYNSDVVNGAQVFYYKNNDLANCIQNRLNILNKKNKRIKKDDIYILEKSIYPCCLVECGFLSGNEDYKNLQDKNYQDSLANAIYLGINDYINK